MRNINKKDLLILIVGIFLISFVSAQEASLGSFTQNQCIELLQTCTNCTFVNISSVELRQPISSKLLNQVQMEKDGIRYNYTFCNTSKIGEYIYWTYGDPNGDLSDPTGVSFSVSPIGLTQSTSQGIGSAIFLVLMVCLMLVFGWAGFKLFKTDNWWVVGIFLVFFACLLLIYNTYLGYQYHRLFTGLPDSAVPERIFWILLMIIVSSLLVSLTLLFLKWKKVLRYVKREIKKKDKDDSDLEDWDVDKWAGVDWDPRR